MEKYSRKNLKNIQAIVERETGAAVVQGRKPSGYRIRRMALLACSLLCFVSLCAFAYAKFSGLDGDEAGFGAAYQGNGRFEIVIVNDSDKELKLQDKVKVMQWSTAREVEGDNKKIKMETAEIAPHSQGTIFIDLSEGYDIAAMEEGLPEGDSYYFVLTNNNFVFGQDWMCFFDFERETVENVGERLAAAMQEREKREVERKADTEASYGKGSLIYPDWAWPTVSRLVSVYYGDRGTEHVNIAGTSGDEIYAVADGTVTEVSYKSTCGNYIRIDLGDGVTVKYGHLQEAKVSEGEEITRGQVIGTMGKTGMATGVNLWFEVTVDGESVNPFAE